jgi:hypothetical protein
MLFQGWRQNVKGQGKLSGRWANRRPARFRPRLEPLEDRLLLAIYTVNSVGDEPDNKPGDGIADIGPVDPNTGLVIPTGITTLRAAIMEANAEGGPATIHFALGAGGVGTIHAVNGPLPAITVPVTIDGTSQPGFDPLHPAPIVVLAGSGLVLAGGGSTVQGLVINGTPGSAGVTLASSSNIVTGNYLGTDIAGGTAVPNAEGVVVGPGAAFNTIGGTTAATRNLISGNTLEGIILVSTAHNVVQGNYVGTDVTGTRPVPNGNGIALLFAVDNTIGGSAALVGGQLAGPGNLIAGNTLDGVLLQSFCTMNLVQGNYIGTDLTGGVALGNGKNGVEINNGADNQVGGTSDLVGGALTGEGNVISGNGADGVLLVGSSAADNKVLGNFIGLDVTGDPKLGNAGNGVTVNAPLAVVGAAVPPGKPPQVISDNGGDGVQILPLGFGTQVHGNFIGTDVTGTKPLGNTNNGVDVVGAAATAIGSSRAAGAPVKPDNLISDNGGDGVLITGAGAAGNAVDGDFIGTDLTGKRPLGNAKNGVEIRAAGPNLVGAVAPAPDNVISDNGADGILILGGTGANRVRGNYLGTDVTGTRPLGNTGDGVEIAGSGANVIGVGAPLTPDNLISDNGNDGILIIGAAPGNSVNGNYIGTDVSGMNPLGNSKHGVSISGAAGNTIGGPARPAAGPDNLIADNGVDGVRIADATAVGNTVQYNYIGTDVTGGHALANRANGVEINDAPTNAIGVARGPADEPDNLIAGNTLDGVLITGAAAAGNTVAGNNLGADVTSAAGLGNLADGVAIVGGANGNTVGGPLATDRNLISDNVEDGVYLADPDTSGNTVLGNSIGTEITGTDFLGNGGNGVTLANGATGNTIGGAASNLLSGNGGDGVLLTDAGTSGNLVQGNFIGTDYMGVAALGNVGHGVEIVFGASNNLIGGPTVAGAAAGNLISGNGGDGVRIANPGTTSNLVQGNSIGTNAAGTRALPNQANGVEITRAASGNTIGGANLGAVVSGNLISGNRGIGVRLADVGTARNLVQGNFIGTNAAGTAALANAASGVQVALGAFHNTIGGTAAEGNVISGNGGDGVRLHDPDTEFNVVQSNHIGTNAAGTAAIPNAFSGVYLFNNASNNTIGGAGRGNVVGGNVADGVFLGNSGTTANLVQGNFIGTDPGGSLDLGNGGNGVHMAVGASDNTIGGRDAVPGPAGSLSNTIAFNHNDGVLVETGTGDDVAGNSIFANRRLGIELLDGGNQSVPAPVLTDVRLLGGDHLSVLFAPLDPARGPYGVDVFVSPAGEPSGVAEGKTYLGTVLTDGTNITGSSLGSHALPPGEFIFTATATDRDHNTSAFSTAFVVAAPGVFFDFDAGGPPPAGFQGVRGGDVYTPARGYGWLAPAGEFDRGGPDALLRDGHYGTNNTFVIDLANGPYVVTVNVGDAVYPHDFIDVRVGGVSQLGGDPISNPPGQFVSRTFAVTVSSGQLPLQFLDLGGIDPYFVVNALVIRPAPTAPLALTGPGGPLTADGTTVDTYTGSGAPANALLTVRTTLGTITSADASPIYVGTQVQADVQGKFTFTVRRPTGAGPGALTVTVGDVLGAGQGTATVALVEPDNRHFDFDTTGTPTAAGYVGVRGSDLYTPARGFGWLAPAAEFGRPYGNALVQDGHYGSAPNTFQMDLAPGTYEVTATVGDTVYPHDFMDIRVAGVSQLGGRLISNAPGQVVVRNFTVTVGADGHLPLQFLDLGGSDPYWVVNGLDVRPASAVLPLTLTGPGGTLGADGSTVDWFSVTAPAGAEITLATSLGTLVGLADADPVYAGLQVIGTGGPIRFGVLRPTGAGVAVITAEDVTGAAAGSFSQTYSAGQSRLLDMNGVNNLTAPGYRGVRGSEVYTDATGYGWLAPAGEFERAGPDALHFDGHYGSAPNVFRIEVDTSATAPASYTVTVTLGDFSYPRDWIRVTLLGTGLPAQTVAYIPGGTFVDLTFVVTAGSIPAGTVAGSGYLDVQFEDLGGDPFWVVNAITVVPSGGAQSAAAGAPALPSRAGVATALVQAAGVQPVEPYRAAPDPAPAVAERATASDFGEQPAQQVSALGDGGARGSRRLVRLGAIDFLFASWESDLPGW